MARILIFHGYLLAGTGSNVYNARLAQTLARLGHDVHLLCQERHPERLGFVDAAGDWDSGRCGSALRDWPAARAVGGRAGSCTVYRPDIGGLLPVYVADRYEGVEARTFAELTDEQLARYLGANVEAVAEVAALAGVGLALANHLVMGPVILARALDRRVPYAVKVHGSALEYTVKPEPERFAGLAREGIGAPAVLVGSRHTAESLWHTIPDPELPGRTRLGRPGWTWPLPPPRARPAVAGSPRGRRAGAAPEPQPAGEVASAFARDPRRAGTALGRIGLSEPLVAFVGKLIVSKGPDLLLAAWPLVLERGPDARLLMVGFGAFREGLEELAAALRDGDLERARELPWPGARWRAGRTRTRAPLRYLLAFLDGLRGAGRERYRRAAGRSASGSCSRPTRARGARRVLPACTALVVPSTFPEAFGMVAAEAAACGVLPVSAAHSGLAEVSGALAARVPAAVRRVLSFELGDGAVQAIAGACWGGWSRAGPTRANP